MYSNMQNFPIDSDILMQIKHLSKCLKQDFDLRLESFGLTSQQGRLLFCINKYFDENKAIHQSDLEELFHLSKSSVSEILSRMQSNNLITRVLDKPYFKIVPTESGRAIIDKILDSRKETISKLFTGFSNADIANISSYISRMIINIEKEDEVCGIK